MKTKVNLKAKRISETGKRIGTTLLALAMITGVCTPAITSFTQAQPVTKTKKKAKAKKKTKAKKTKSKKKKSYKAKAGTISLRPITLTKGKSRTVSVKTKSKVRWTSSNAKVASVKSISKSKVKVTAKKEGSTKVSGKAGSAKWSFTVKVKGKPAPTPSGKKGKATKGKKSKATSKKAVQSNTKKDSSDDNNNNVAEVKKAEEILKAKATAILNECGASSGTSDIQKFARLCRWWTLNVSYDEEEANTDKNYYSGPWLNKYGDKEKLSQNMDTEYLNAIRIVELHKGVCGNQAEAFKYFGDLLGLKTVTLTSTSTNHEWLHVYIEDGWYTFDPVFICKDSIYYVCSFDEYLQSSDGQKTYRFYYDNLTYRNNQEIAEKAKKRTFEDFERLEAYRIADLHDDDDSSSWKGNTETTNEAHTPPYLINGSTPISETECNNRLNGKKYINAFLYKYL